MSEVDIKCSFNATESVLDTSYRQAYHHTTNGYFSDGVVLCQTPRFEATAAQITLLIDDHEHVSGAHRSFFFQFYSTLLVSDFRRNCVLRFVADTGKSRVRVMFRVRISHLVNNNADKCECVVPC